MGYSWVIIEFENLIINLLIIINLKLGTQEKIWGQLYPHSGTFPRIDFIADTFKLGMELQIVRQIESQMDRYLFGQIVVVQSDSNFIRQLDRQKVRWIDCQIDRKLDGQIVRWIESQMDRQLDRQKVRWIDSWMDRKLDGQIVI